MTSITSAVEQAERLSGYALESAFVGIGGDHVECAELPRRGRRQRAAHREVTREDIDRATEVARAVNIPTNREVLHVLPRGFVVDGQEGVKDPLGMSAIRLEVETHIVHGSATVVQNLTKCVRQAGDAHRRAGRRARSRRPRPSCPRPSVSSASRSPTSAPAPPTSPSTWMARPSTRRSCRWAATTSPTTSPSASRPTSPRQSTSRSASGPPTSTRSTADEDIQVEVIGEGEAGRVERLEICEIIEARMREIFEKLGEEIAAAGHGGILPAGSC